MHSISLDKKIAISLMVILILATGLRFYKLGEKSFSADEFLGVNATYGYLQTGEWRRWDFNLDKPLVDNDYFKTFFDFDIWKAGADTYTRAWAYNWQVAQALKFLPVNSESSYRLISALWGILSVLIIYWVAFKFTNNKIIGLLSALLMALSIDSIEFSRRMRMYIMFSSIFLLFSYTAFNLFESKVKSKWKYLNNLNEKLKLNILFLLPTIFLGLLSMHLHLLAGNFAFIALIYFLILGVISYKQNKIIKNHYLIYATLAILMGVIISSKGSALFSSLGFENHFSYFDKSFADYPSYILAILVLGAGGYYLIKNKTKEGIFLVVNYLAILLGAVFLWSRNTGEQYLFFAKPFQIILMAAGIWWIASWLMDNLKKNNQKIYWASMIILITALVNWGYFFQTENTYKQTSKSENPDYKKVFNYIISEKSPEDVFITRNFRNFYWPKENVKVYSLGGERSDEAERKITLSKLSEIIQDNSSGWIIYSDNDESFISKEAVEYIENKLERSNNIKIRGPIKAYRWNNANK